MHHFMQRIPSEHIRKELSNVETLTEERVEVIIRIFLHDLEENAPEGNGWPLTVPAYGMSKVTLDAYTRILANTTKKSSCLSAFFPAFLRTTVIDKPVLAFFENAGIGNPITAAQNQLFTKRCNKSPIAAFFKNAGIGGPKALG